MRYLLFLLPLILFSCSKKEEEPEVYSVLYIVDFGEPTDFIVNYAQDNTQHFAISDTQYNKSSYQRTIKSTYWAGAKIQVLVPGTIRNIYGKMFMNNELIGECSSFVSGECNIPSEILPNL